MNEPNDETPDRDPNGRWLPGQSANSATKWGPGNALLTMALKGSERAGALGDHRDSGQGWRSCEAEVAGRVSNRAEEDRDNGLAFDTTVDAPGRAEDRRASARSGGAQRT